MKLMTLMSRLVAVITKDHSVEKKDHSNYHNSNNIHNYSEPEAVTATKQNGIV
jgi:hypothetical protein